MKPVIDYKTEGIHFNFIVKKQYTKIIGDSGTGKTFFCTSLNDNIKVSNILGTYPVTDLDTKKEIKTLIIDLDNTDSNIIKTTKNSLVIIDEADIILNKCTSMIDDILNNCSNIYVIICRSVIPSLKFYMQEFATIKEYDNELRVEYIVS